VCALLHGHCRQPHRAHRILPSHSALPGDERRARHDALTGVRGGAQRPAARRPALRSDSHRRCLYADRRADHHFAREANHRHRNMSGVLKPGTIPEAMFRREILPWALIGLTLGLVEGGTAAVLVKQHFSGAASPMAVNLAVAFVSGAPALSNVMSFVWANLAHGRERVRLMVA